MNDHDIDTLVRRAAAPTPLGPELDGAERRLLEDIVSTHRHRGRSATLMVLATAAAVASLVVAGRLVAPARTSAEPAAPVMTTTPSATTGSTAYTLSALNQAKAGPRLVLDAPGWSVQHLDRSSMFWHAGLTGEVRTKVPGGVDVSRRGQNLDVDWYPASSYQGYLKDRSHVSAVQEVPVLGVTGRMVTYERGDYAVMLPPSHGIFVEIRSSGLAGEAAYRELLAQLRVVTARQWLDSLPETVVVPCSGCSEVARMLAGIPLPPGFDTADAAPKGAADYYQTGAHVAGAVTCAWLASWTKAVAADDAVTRDRAVAALATSRGWAVLKKMNPEGDYPEVVWDYADQIARGQTPEGYQDALGCGS